MKLVLDAHTHTLASGHAYSTIMEYVAEAAEIGLELIAVTDHTTEMPCSIGEFYFTNFCAVPETVNGVRLMLGAELNIMDKSGRVDMSERTLEQISPVIASFHPPCYKYSSDNMSFEEKSAEITDALMLVMDNKHVQIIGHPGDPRYPFDIEKVVRKSVETGTLLEINNASLNKKSFRYGSRDTMLELLKSCKKADCPVVLGSDAHFVKLCGRFDDAIELLNEAGFPEELVANVSIERFCELLSFKKTHTNG